MKQILTFLVLCFAFVWMSAQERGDLLSDTLLANFTAAEVNVLYSQNGIPPGILASDFGVEEYKISYQTIDADGSPTFATGLVVIPVGITCPAPLGVYNHGTFSDLASMPSNLGTEHMLGVGFAASGYVGVLPDLVGYGDSPGFPNYQHAKSTGTANVDMLRAARHFCAGKGIELNGQIFITGYSQGGHSAMAAHREIETYYANEFTVTACAPLSGAYDMSGVQTDFVFDDDYYEGNVYLGYIIMAFKEIYPELIEWEFDEVFQSPYDTILYNRLTAFNTPLGELNGMLPTNPADLIQPDLLADFLSNPDHPFRVVLRDNDAYDWAPVAPVQMSYCEGDQSIYYQNAIVAQNSFIANGATNVTAVSRGASFGHGSCILPAILASKNWFDSLKEDCTTSGTSDLMDNDKQNVMAYPNPMGQHTTFMVKNLEYPISQIRIFDLTGKPVLTFSDVQAHHFTISADGLQSGMYIAEITIEGKTQRIKLLVK